MAAGAAVACPGAPAGGHGELLFPTVDAAGRSVGVGWRRRSNEWVKSLSATAFPSTSANRTALGNAERTRTLMDCFDSTSRKGTDLSAHSPDVFAVVADALIHGPARPSDGELSPKLWTSACRPVKLNMLRRPVEPAQYVSIKYTERLAVAGIEPSVGSVGDSYDDTLAETISVFTIAGFGTFGTRNRPARTGRNPRTGKSLLIPASAAPVFKAGKGLRDALNGGNAA